MQSLPPETGERPAGSSFAVRDHPSWPRCAKCGRYGSAPGAVHGWCAVCLFADHREKTARPTEGPPG